MFSNAFFLVYSFVSCVSISCFVSCVHNTTLDVIILIVCSQLKILLKLYDQQTFVRNDQAHLNTHVYVHLCLFGFTSGVFVPVQFLTTSHI